jgi:hypothetical protein
MLVADAREVARAWLAEEAARLPGFEGAWSAGSSNWLPGDAELPATSDVDLVVVVGDGAAAPTGGKRALRGVLLDVTYLPKERVDAPDAVLGDYRLAGGLRAPGVLVDPSGWLSRVQTAVARDFARRDQVVRRCEDARANVLRHLRADRPSAPFHDRVTAWCFAAGVTTHVLLAAGLRNPTVRLRYLAVRSLLAEYGRLDLYGDLLRLLGCDAMPRAAAERHLDALASAFDAAATAIRTPFPFAPDLTGLARPVAIDGGRDLVARGLHREAVFWLVATYARCQKVLFHDAPAAHGRFEPGFRRLLGDLGIASAADLDRRREQVRASLPWVWAGAEAILAANPEISPPGPPPAR